MHTGKQYPADYDGKQYFNAGVMAMRGNFPEWSVSVCDESPHGCQDQNALNLAVLRGELRWHPLDKRWNYGHMRTIPEDIYSRAHIVHCNFPDLAPCALADSRIQAMQRAASLLPTRRVNIGKAKPKHKILMATVVSGSAYEDIYMRTEHYHRDYADRHGMDYTSIRTPSQNWPSPSWWSLEIEKEFDDGYDGIFFCDCDAWPWAEAPNISEVVPQGRFGALNSFVLPGFDADSIHVKSYWDWCAASGITDAPDPGRMGFYTNAGIWFCWRAARDILLPESKIESPRYFEQHAVNLNLYRNPELYCPLGREWNYGHLHVMGSIQAAIQKEVYIPHLNGVEKTRRAKVMRRMMTQREVLMNK
jgi:hypothetical protein